MSRWRLQQPANRDTSPRGVVTITARSRSDQITCRSLWHSTRRPGPALVASGPADIRISISIVVIFIISGFHAALNIIQVAEGSQQQQQEQQQRQMHPSLFVDTKYWLRNTEFGERDNWLDARRPCSLIERTVVDENALVISMGDAMDSIDGVARAPRLKSDIREFVLAQDGILLLEEDTLALDPLDPAFIQYLNDSGDCFESASLPEEIQRAHWFRFKPHPDELSWFNPSNWASGLTELDAFSHLVPESHQVPCGEDVVVFGSRSGTFWPVVEANERAHVLAFKVNFRASEASNLTLAQAKAKISAPLRVSKLKIGDKSYTQSEFDQLIAQYGNNLFELRDEQQQQQLKAATEFGPDIGYDATPQNLLTIDESSIQAETGDYELCLDEAGCECGNEQPSRMELICSFNQPLELHEMPCHDPVQSAGYCNKICATLLIINMDPTKFSERFLASLLNKIMTAGLGFSESSAPSSSDDYFSEHLFVGSRRVDHSKYEITMRLVPADNDVYANILGRDIELAKMIKQELEKAATMSFYGIKTINIKSSVEWRQDNSNSLFALALLMSLSLSMIVFTKFDDHLIEIIIPLVSLGHANSSPNVEGHLSTINNEALIADDSESIYGGAESISMDNRSRAVDHLAMVDLDTNSTTGSIVNLLDAC